MREYMYLSKCMSLTCHHRLLDMTESTSEADIQSRKSDSRRDSNFLEYQIMADTEKTLNIPIQQNEENYRLIVQFASEGSELSEMTQKFFSGCLNKSCLNSSNDL